VSAKLDPQGFRNELITLFQSMSVEGYQEDLRMAVGDVLIKVDLGSYSPCDVWLDACEQRYCARTLPPGAAKTYSEKVWTQIIEMVKKYI
jgi:hypothetical protein